MKIIEPEILIVVALKNIELNDFSLSSDNLVKKAISENPDIYDLDILFRILSQIMTKISIDLKERITGSQKLQIFHLVSKFIKTDINILEKFISSDPSLSVHALTPITMELGSQDYKTLNEQYLRELHMFEKKNNYLNSNSLEFGSISSKLYQEQELKDANKNNSANSKSVIKAQYIDKSPDLVLGTKDNILYYFDSSSGTISEMPLNSKQIPVSINDLKTILTTNKIKKGDIDNTVNLLATTIQPNTTEKILSEYPVEDKGFFSKLSLSSMFTSVTTTTQPYTTQQTTQTTQSVTKMSNENNNKTPIPPEFLKQLYNSNKHYSNSNNNNNTNYNNNTNSNNSVNNFASITPTNSEGSQEEIHTPQNIDNVNNLDEKEYVAQLTTQPTNEEISHFSNSNDIPHNTPHDNVINKIKINNKKIENIAIGFITSIILIFMLVIYNAFRNKK